MRSLNTQHGPCEAVPVHERVAGLARMIRQGIHVEPCRQIPGPLPDIRKPYWSTSFSCYLTREVPQSPDPGSYWLMQRLFGNISTCRMTLKEINGNARCFDWYLGWHYKMLFRTPVRQHMRCVLGSPLSRWRSLKAYISSYSLVGI